MCTCDNAAYFHTHIDDLLEDLGLTTDPQGNVVKSHSIVDIIEGYDGEGYGQSTEEELGQWSLFFLNSSRDCLFMCVFYTVQMREIMRATGVTLDPVYTLKGVRGMLCEMRTNPARFQGNRVLYVHTGKPKC